MIRQYGNITGAELLRADVNSQQITIIQDEQINERRELITPKQFWGDEKGSGLYFPYEDEKNSDCCTVATDGWGFYPRGDAHTMDQEKTKQWLDHYVFNTNSPSITIFQGYAGCGKTIFINSLLRSPKFQNSNSSITDVYVDYDNDLSEEGYLVNSIRNKLSKLLTSCMKTDNGNKILSKYKSLLLKSTDFFSSIVGFISLFSPDGLISEYLLDIYNHRNENDLSSKTEAFKMQFLCGSKYIAANEKSELIPPDGKLDSLANVDAKWMQLLLENYLVMHYLLLHAINIVENRSHSIVVYDNLDIIDNPTHITSLIRKIQEILYIFCEKNQTLEHPIFKVILAVRKITLNRIADEATDEVEPGAVEKRYPVQTLDISNLYSATTILKHKATVLMGRFQEFFPKELSNNDIPLFLTTINALPDKVFHTIGLPDLFNHNIRACANILDSAHKRSKAIQAPTPPTDNPSLLRCYSTIWLNYICAELLTSEVWKNLGFDTFNDDRKDHNLVSPSRLILTYLYNKRKDFEHNRAADNEANLIEIVGSLEKHLITKCDKEKNNKSIWKEKTIQGFNEKAAREEIITAIANMLGRNKATGMPYPSFEEELWRRPIYYTKHTFPLVDKDKKSRIIPELENQLNPKTNPNAKFTYFCITDEGNTFIETIVTSFEFFSVRVNGHSADPLCSIAEVSLLQKITKNVYQFVKNTVDDHLLAMSHNLNMECEALLILPQNKKREIINRYMHTLIHAKDENNKPQLHMVRTIFDHIYALNDYRDYLISINHPNLEDLNRCLVSRIGIYLRLYKNKYYNLLDGTIGSRNDVYRDLKYLYYLIAKTKGLMPKDDNDMFYISIDRKNASGISWKPSLISEQRLLDYEPTI